MSYVMCRTCANYKNEWCEKIADSPDPNYDRICWHYVEATHHDMLLNMPVGVLAVWLEGVTKRSSQEWLKWLNAPYIGAGTQEGLDR